MSATPKTDAVAKEIGRLAYQLCSREIHLPEFAKLAQEQLDRLEAVELELIGATLALDELNGRANALVVAGDALDRMRSGECDCDYGICACDKCQKTSVNWSKAKEAFTNPI